VAGEAETRKPLGFPLAPRRPRTVRYEGCRQQNYGSELGDEVGEAGVEANDGKSGQECGLRVVRLF
jgi:hypothetical protein